MRTDYRSSVSEKLNEVIISEHRPESGDDAKQEAQSYLLSK